MVEVLAGLTEGDTVITTGAAALRDGDRIVLPGGTSGRGRRGGAGSDGRLGSPDEARGAPGAAAPRPVRTPPGARAAPSHRRRGRSGGSGAREGGVLPRQWP